MIGLLQNTTYSLCFEGWLLSTSYNWTQCRPKNMNLKTAKLKTLSFSSATERNCLTEEKGSCDTHTLSQWLGEIIFVWFAISFIWIAKKYEVWAAAPSCWNKAKISHNSGRVHCSFRASFSGFLTSSLTLNSSQQTPRRPLLSNSF